jgi:predicted HAD superfamily Cof-like phosphohydrolase
MYQMVEEFHKKFDVPVSDVPVHISKEMFDFRTRFMQEELDEFCEAWYKQDLVKQADALADLIYVALGTAVIAGIPLEDVFELVQNANMRKSKLCDLSDDDPRKQQSVRHATDVVKPQGWIPPEAGIAALLLEYGMKL